MKCQFVGSLGLTLTFALSAVLSEEVHWHPTASPNNRGGGTVPANAASLGRPVAVPDAMTPVDFRAVAPDDPQRFVRGQNSDPPQPMPPGPGPKDPKDPQELLPPPTPLPDVKPPSLGVPHSASTEVWGGFASEPLTGVPPVPGGDACAPGCAPACPVFPCEQCCDSFGSRFWGSAEYLLWSIRDSRLPPLLTTTTLTDAQIRALMSADPNFRVGALGALGTQLLFGNSAFDNENFSGGRFTAGMWFARFPDLGLENTFFFLGERTNNFIAGTNGQPALFRPFDNVINPPQDALTVGRAVNGTPVIAGTFVTSLTSRLWGDEVMLRYKLLRGCDYKLDLLGGFRYVHLGESLNIADSETFLVNVPSLGIGAGDNITVFDRFSTHNNFYGGQLGLDFEYRYGRWLLGLRGKVALGSMNEQVNISGNTIFTGMVAGGGSVSRTGGFLALPSNIGQFNRDHLAWVPEIGLKVGYQLSDHVRLYVGYDFMYLSEVVRPGDQIDLGVNSKQLPGRDANGVLQNGMLMNPARPTVLFRSTDFWAQGVSLGLEFRY
jgi:hypothetical protein